MQWFLKRPLPFSFHKALPWPGLFPVVSRTAWLSPWLMYHYIPELYGIMMCSKWKPQHVTVSHSPSAAGRKELHGPRVTSTHKTKQWLSCVYCCWWHRRREEGIASQPEDKKPQLLCLFRVTQDIRNSSSSRSVPANIGARTVTQPVSPFSMLPCSVTHHLACGTRQEPFTGHDSEHPLRCSGMEPALPPPPPGPSPQHICS